MLRCRRKKNRGFGYYLAANCCGITDFHVLQMATAVAFIFMARQHLLSLQRWQQHWLPLLKVSQAPGLLWLQFGVIKTINRSQRGSLLLPPHLGCCMSSPSCPGCWHLAGVQAAAAHRTAGIAHTAGVGFSTVLTSNPSSALMHHLIIKI